MGRREKPVDPDAGPVQRLAHELRLLRGKAGKPPYREMAARAGYSITAMSQAAAGDQLPSLAVVRAYTEALGADPDEWEGRWREADAEVRAPLEDEKPPYRGLARFEPGDSELFFGRETLLAELVELVREHRFAAVFGPSGSGKSSLLRAGLIPSLRQAAGAERPAVIRVLAPGEWPARTHAEALVPRDGDGETWVIVDQFEELFTLCHDRAERDRFLGLLLAARRPDSGLRVVVVVRGDFYGHCAEHRELATAVSRAGLLVGPMSRDELREAITGPAAAAGLNVERTLTARIVDEVVDQPGALPMLSHALLETWHRRRGRLLTLAAYEAAGGVRGAIAATAEKVYGQVSAEQSRIARRILLRLIAPGDGTADTRRPASRAELGSGAQEVLERLVAARLVTLDGDTVELSHEALITGWPRLAGWIEESRERLRAQRRLGEAARGWEELARDPGALYRGTRLAGAAELFVRQPGDDLTHLERDFLTASLAAQSAEREAETRTARRTRSLTIALSVFLVLALTAGLVAWQRNEVSREESAKATARRLATVAGSLRTTDPRTAALLGVAAWKMAPLTESRSALLGSLAQPERDAFTDPLAGRDVRRFLSDSGRTLLSVEGTTVTTRKVTDHKLTATYRLPSGTEVGDVGPDSRFLYVIGPDGGNELWNLPEGRSEAELGTASWWGGSADGKTYLTGPPDGPGAAALHRTDDGQVLFTTDLARTLSSAAAGPGGRLLALCPADGPLQLWDTAGRKRLPGAWEKADRTVCGTGSGADDGTRLLRFSADGRRLAAVYGTRALVWDVRSGRTLADFASAGSSGFTQAALSANGEFLATADDHELAVWRLANGGTQVFDRPMSKDQATGLTWDPGKPGLLRYLDGATVHTLDLAARLTPRWHNTPTDASVLSPDGAALATVTRSGADYRFELRATLPHSRLRSSGGTPMGRVLAQAKLGPLPSTFDEDVPLSAFSPDGRALALADTVSSHGSSRLRFTVWDVRTHRIRTVFDTSGAADRPATALALGPGGRTLLAVRSTAGTSTMEVWNTRDHRRSRTVRGFSGKTLAGRPDGGLLVSSDDQYTDPGAAGVSGRALADGRQVTSLAFSPDGTQLAAGDSTGHVTLWDGAIRDRTGALTGTSDTVTQGEPEAVGALAFSSDGGTLAVGGANGTLRLWDTEGHQLLGTDLPTPGDEIHSLAFAEDGSTVYAGGPHVPLLRFPVGPDQVAHTVCARAGGGLTAEQWRTYVPDAPYESVCPTSS
ncbi:hypothetical protein ACFWAZ_05595 [Streptomyces collinus]|uniref:nSTAND1 domain-containing NTPase n=1 Tax=Streptomyces collinus TaxID=42684 RepID=UPI003654F21E